ncbi:MAG: CtsR family transcriptional regulator [Candidatus Neoclostridium sp.]
MANLSDLIEAFLLQTLGEDDELRISRNELANYFSVAPSQINYVLATRFTPDRGYTVESRRGGGGGVTVVRIRSGGNAMLNDVMQLPLSEGLSYARSCNVVDRMVGEKVISEREGRLLKAALTDKALVTPTVTAKDCLRASIIKSVLVEALKCEKERQDQPTEQKKEE